MIRLAIVEGNKFFRLGLKTALESAGDIKVVGEFEDICRIADEIALLAPDTVLMSTGWPDDDALDACREIRSTAPMTKVVLMSSMKREEEAVGAMMAGASGYISRDVSSVELDRAVHLAVSGGLYFDRQVTAVCWRG